MTSSLGWKLCLAFLVVNLLLLNIGLAFLWRNSGQPNPLTSSEGSSSSYQELETKVNQLENRLAQIQNTPTVEADATTVTPLPPPKQQVSRTSKTTSYMPIPGSGSILSYDWINLSGTEFYFNPADFPGFTDVRFEANMQLFNGNGLAFLRLFDVTNGIEIWGSQIQTDSQNSTVVVSDSVQFRPGNNLVVVQAKSLTADTTVFNSGRLKINIK